MCEILKKKEQKRKKKEQNKNVRNFKTKSDNKTLYEGSSEFHKTRSTAQERRRQGVINRFYGTTGFIMVGTTLHGLPFTNIWNHARLYL